MSPLIRCYTGLVALTVALGTAYMTMTPHDRLTAATLSLAEARVFIEAHQGAFSYSPWDINLDDIHEHLAYCIGWDQ